ncbi:hypothetical protein E7L52_22395, partial [Bacillus paralicheniformis]|uniref:histone H1/H5 family protein n=1 Tax=Bacillus paralicheniformis TaxID=1648923 RepID=UPI0010ADA058
PISPVSRFFERFVMSSTGENEKTNVVDGEQPAAEQPSNTVEKPAKEKKAKVPKEKKPKTAKIASHPPYFQMIKEALLGLNEKGGSSPHAIAKYMEEKHKAVLPENFRKMLALQLKNSASKGNLTKIKASYKLSESGKKEKAPATVAGKKKPTVAAKKPRQAKTKKSATATAGGEKKAEKVVKKLAKIAPGKKPAAKKVKKMTPAKPKQAKSIKSPAAKKARKATA